MAIEVDVNDNGTIDIEYGGTNASTASGARTNLGLGSAAELDAGNAEGEVVVVLADQKLPVLDGSNLTNVQPVGGGVTSVNTETGDVVLDADDIQDGTNYAIITKVEQANVAHNTLVISRIEDVEGAVEDAEASAAAALVSETNAAASELAADADASQTALDRIQTTADATQTALDRIQTTSDAAATANDAIDTAADAVSTAADVVDTAADRVQTGIDSSESSVSAAAALVSENKAEQWAEEAENVEVETGEYSAHHWAIKAQSAATFAPVSAGMVDEPTYTDHGDGSITINGAGAHLFDNAVYSGLIVEYTIPSNTFTLADNDTSYITVDYNLGNPVYVSTTDVSGINESDVIPVFTINRNGIILSIMSWDELGIGLPNKLHTRFVKTDRLAHESGLALTEAATRLVNISSGIVWAGAASNIVNTFASDVNSLRLFYHDTGVWVSTLVTQYDNDHYDDGNELQSLGTAKYAVNWIFRNVSEDCCAGILLGGGSYNLAEALDSPMPSSLPENIQAQGILVGRIIVQNGASTATQIDGAFTINFSGGAAIQNHNDLANIQGGAVDDYYHLTSADATVVDEVDLQRHTVSEMQFKSQAAANRDKFGGSGFVEWGKHNSLSDYPNINEGMWEAAIEAYKNSFIMGRNDGFGVGVSKSLEPIMNLNGIIQRINGVNRAADYPAVVLLPDAPAVSTLTERQDLVFLESWHELISTKDIVYPFGNVQSLLATDPSTGLTTIVPSFTGFATYSLFGNWQTASDLIGLGLIWSTMTDANKKKFVSDPENNIYLNEDGDLVQVRYRIRVVEGLGADWEGLSTCSDNWYLLYDSSNFVKPKGSKTGITADIANYSANATGSFASLEQSNSDIMFPDGEVRGHFAATTLTASEPDTAIAYKGLCQALPIALVSRRNQGAFHPVFNPNGTKAHQKDTDPAAARVWYHLTALEISSTEEAFSLATTGTSNGSGSLEDTDGNLDYYDNPVRPDLKFYDAIYESDVLDLRNSAQKPLDLNRTLQREFNKLVAGETRGWEKSPFAETPLNPTGNASTGYGVVYSGASSIVSVGDRVLLSHSTGRYIVTVGVSGSASFTWDSSFSLPSQMLTTDYFSVLKDGVEAKTLLQCDIIGDPDSYPQSWKDNGVMGTPLIVGEEGEDYTAAGSSNVNLIKLSRKVKDADLSLVLRTEDAGATWIAISGGVDATTNLLTINSGNNVGRIWMIFYLTEASPFEVVNKAEVVSVSKVQNSNRYDVDKVTSNLIGKVAVATSAGYDKRTLLNGYDLFSGKIVSFSSAGVNHNDITPDNVTNPAVKTLPYLTRENGKLFLQAIFKEMKFDDSMANAADIVSFTDPSVSISFVAGTYYKTNIAGLVDQRYILYCITSITIEFNNLFFYPDGIYDSNGVKYFEFFNGSGWGDDNKFDVVDGVETTTDDNGNTILVGQKRLELPYFIGDGE